MYSPLMQPRKHPKQPPRKLTKLPPLMQPRKLTKVRSCCSPTLMLRTPKSRVGSKKVCGRLGRNKKKMLEHLADARSFNRGVRIFTTDLKKVLKFQEQLLEHGIVTEVNEYKNKEKEKKKKELMKNGIVTEVNECKEEKKEEDVNECKNKEEEKKEEDVNECKNKEEEKKEEED
ncbi:hypothetical protein GQ457_03G042730 [Hibiscus cannabinus]